jgi:hypothetical protein
MGVIQNIINKSVPSPKRFNCDLPPAVESILSRALSKNRDARFQTATDFRLAIEDFLGAARLKELQEDIKSLLITNGATIALRSSSLAKSGANRTSKKSSLAFGVFGAVAVSLAIVFLVPGVRDTIQGWFGQSAHEQYGGGDAMKGALAGDHYSRLPFHGAEKLSAQPADSSGMLPDTMGVRPSSALGGENPVRMENTAVGPAIASGGSPSPNPRENPHGQTTANASPPPDSTAGGRNSSVTDTAGGEAHAANQNQESAGSTAPAEEPQAKPIAKKGWLSVAAWPSAEIHIDGRYIGDIPPTMSVELAGGYHKLECKNPMHEPYIEEIKIISGELSRRNITLKKLRGQISLAATEGAEFYVDGNLVGITPIMEPIVIDAGKHHLTLKRAGFHIWNSKITLQANQVLPLKIVLSPKY